LLSFIHPADNVLAGAHCNQLCRMQVTHEVDFCCQTHDLLPDGANIAVTGANRSEFVRRYVDFLLVKRIAPQFDSFLRGFRRVCDSAVLLMFIAPELEQVVCGVQEIDFQELQRGAQYDGGFTSESTVVGWLWEVPSWLSCRFSTDSFIVGSSFRIISIKKIGVNCCLSLCDLSFAVARTERIVGAERCWCANVSHGICGE
jgi:hypothetical protein